MTEKGSYETYEYVAEGNEHDQFFLVQDDGSFLSLSNRQVQYLTQGQDIKEVVNNDQPCEMFDVTSPQLLLSANNSAEGVPDQLTLPNGESIIIADNYLIPASNTIEEQVVQQDEEPEKVKTTEDVEIQKTDECTEITLSDEQFHTLEQKGQILLETNDKVYILDTSGLHDITTNDKLIQKFKCPDGRNDCEDDATLSSHQDIQLHIEGDGIKLSKDIFGDHSSYIMNLNPDQHDQSMEVSSLDITNQTVITEIEGDAVQNDNTAIDIDSVVDAKCEQLPNDNNENDDLKLKDVLKTSNTRNLMFKVSTNIAFKDIPRKIALGETISGKKLFAKITKLNTIDLPITQDSSIYEQRVLRKKVCINNKEKKLKTNSGSAEEQLFESVVHQWWERRGGAGGEGGGVRCSALDVASAHTTVMQLLKIPEFKNSVLDQNIIITKVVSEQDEQGAYSSCGQPSLVTGRVAPDARSFLHEPDMLHNITATDDCEPDNKKGDISFIVNDKDDNVLHIHVNEMKRADNILRVSITLNTRKLPSKAISEENKRKLPGKAFACRSCAAIFNTEDELKEHQKTQCSDVEDAIDIDKLVAGYTVVFENGKDKIYNCNQCKMKFVKLHNCIKHLKTHYNSEINSDSSAGQAVIHKCNMCPCTFNHHQTLVKHIVNKHINV